jgi:hypothetical protein
MTLRRAVAILHRDAAMIENELIRLLCEFFEDSFHDDPTTVGDWLAQGSNDVDATIKAIRALAQHVSRTP